MHSRFGRWFVAHLWCTHCTFFVYTLIFSCLLIMHNAPHHHVMHSPSVHPQGLAWMAGGSTRAAFNVSFQRDSNIGDITAKATSQTICTSMGGTAGGMALAGWIEQDVWLACGASAALASVHMGSALMYADCTVVCQPQLHNRCVRSVPLTVVNPSRCEALAHAFVNGGHLPHPLEMAAQEQLWRPWWRSLWPMVQQPVMVNPPIHSTATALTVAALLTRQHAGARYLVLAQVGGMDVLQSASGHTEQGRVQGSESGSESGNEGPAKGPVVSLLVHQHAEACDVAAGMLHACLLRAWLDKGKEAARVVHDGVHRGFGQAVKAAQWDATRVAVLENRMHRYSW